MTGLRPLGFLDHAEDRMEFQPLWIGVVVVPVLDLVTVLAGDIFG